jgi:hypothetical protein
LFGRGERFLVFPEVVVEQRAPPPWRDGQLHPLAAPRDAVDGGLDQHRGLWFAPTGGGDDEIAAVEDEPAARRLGDGPLLFGQRRRSSDVALVEMHGDLRAERGRQDGPPWVTGGRRSLHGSGK